MTAREQYYVDQVIEKYNQLVGNFQLVTIERDTLFEEVNTLKAELARSYREVSELKGSHPYSPVEMSLTEDGAGLIKYQSKTPAV